MASDEAAQLSLEEDLAGAQHSDLLGSRETVRVGAAARQVAVVVAVLLAIASAATLLAVSHAPPAPLVEHTLRAYVPCECDCAWAQGPACGSPPGGAADCCFQHCCGYGAGSYDAISGHGDVYHGALQAATPACKYGIGSHVVIQSGEGEDRLAVVTGVLPGCNYQVDIDGSHQVAAAYSSSNYYRQTSGGVNWLWITVLVLLAFLAFVLVYVYRRK
mmetsp:Transcript_21871/g.61978  ORF Transcript_21871/g.61978 Transcript_21871/m.61978 type:complete len:217 (+) Transcript_21871:77-727(+)